MRSQVSQRESVDEGVDMSEMQTHPGSCAI